MKPKYLSLIPYPIYDEKELITRSKNFYELMRSRRSVRDFSEKSVPVEVIENCIKTAGTAPSGANKQPWHFVLVTDIKIKKRIRIAAEREEKQFYTHRASEEWLQDLAQLGTSADKPFLEKAPFLIVIFEKRYGLTKDGQKIKHYYTNESVGLATGILLAALHQLGLAILTYTPSPMKFLNEILNRPPNDKPFLILVTGYAAKNAKVPDIGKKSLQEIRTII